MLQIDPMTVKYASLTHYNYAFDNPVMWSDPSGADPNETQNQFDAVQNLWNSFHYGSVRDQVKASQMMSATSGEGGTAGDFLGNALTNSAYVGGSWSNGTSHFFRSEREALSYINSQYDFSAEYELIDHGNVANRYEMGMTVKMNSKC